MRLPRSNGYYLCWRRGHLECLLHNIRYWWRTTMDLGT